ncbi:DUF1501 domain-containing protein [Vibrio sp. Isolate24]|uniref:DUF1501 domain-containing protein n=1 Tax=Vibrio sp. Isolate24 TaxID=2908534 RepID=UPI001EFE594F|nr:DUF1501 domain-containing protein [Vibrio sp. Isolate24]MCG9680194.1 DUF1501 domain-containing protein [Vibrio sp. Isolate24]
MSSTLPNRRRFLQSAAALSMSSLLPMPVFAKSRSDNLFIWISLRGAMDGLNVVVPYGDKAYASLRPTIGLHEGQLLNLDGFFGLHPALKACHQWYQAREISFVHACATPYRERSHFDGQKILENGTLDPFYAEGWLNRLLSIESRNQAIAIDSGLPLIMQGEARVDSWYPNRLKTRERQTELLEQLLQSDATLSSNFESMMKIDKLMGDGGVGKQFQSLTQKTGEILADPAGPNIAALELGGWDTHANQGSVNGRLSNQLKLLDAGLASLKQALGKQWQRTVVIAASEFGRTARENGTKGTDHGTANVMFVAGGAIKGGEVLGHWPGLAEADLYQGRDLKPTTDTRSVIKGVLGPHLSVTSKKLETIFPDSQKAKALRFEFVGMS